MARDLMQVHDAVNRAKEINSGLDALVDLLLGCRDSDVPKGEALAELIWSVQKNMDQTLEEALEVLQKPR